MREVGRLEYLKFLKDNRVAEKCVEKTERAFGIGRFVREYWDGDILIAREEIVGAAGGNKIHYYIRGRVYGG